MWARSRFGPSLKPSNDFYLFSRPFYDEVKAKFSIQGLKGQELVQDLQGQLGAMRDLGHFEPPHLQVWFLSTWKPGANWSVWALHAMTAIWPPWSTPWGRSWSSCPWTTSSRCTTSTGPLHRLRLFSGVETFLKYGYSFKFYFVKISLH